MKQTSLFIEYNLPQPFTNEELLINFKKMKTGDKEARNEIIKHNIALVIKEVLKRFSNLPYDKEELVSIGLIGLIKSVDTFDINKNFKFSTYSVKCIDNEILAFIRNEKKHLNNDSLDKSLSNDEEKDLKIRDILYNESDDFVTEYEKQELYEIINKLLLNLSSMDRKIINKYFGFHGNDRMSQKEIANALGSSQANVSRVITRVLQEITLELQRQGIIEYSSKLSEKRSHASKHQDNSKKYVKKRNTKNKS